MPLLMAAGLAAFHIAIHALVLRSRGTMAAVPSDVDLGLEAGEPSNFARRSLYGSRLHCLIEDGAFDDADRVPADAGLDALICDSAFGADLLAARGRLRLAQAAPHSS